MCLTNLKSKEEIEAYKKKQPKEFTVWKIMRENGETEYHSPTESELNIPNKIYKASNKQGLRRCKLTYKPGFHAFRTKRQAKCYQISSVCGLLSYKLQRFKARPEWITQIGKSVNGVYCLVLSYIKVEG